MFNWFNSYIFSSRFNVNPDFGDSFHKMTMDDFYSVYSPKKNIISIKKKWNI